MNIKGYLEQKRVAVDRFLDEVAPSVGTPPVTLHESMRYSLLAGGKRVRPILTIAAAEALGPPPPGLMAVACSLELIHTYSLIHDDLPSMDNDDFRRGRPTNHKVFGEAIAILAGDSLLVYAFELLARARRPECVSTLARALGTKGMLGGQVVDIQSEGKKVGLETVNYIHRHKTAALIE